VLTYQRLLKEQESLDDDETDCWLYYHGRGHRAEFVVWRADGYMVYDGHIDGDGRSGEFEFDLDEELAALEQYWKAQKVPPSYPHPFFRSFGECISGSKSKGHFPSCQFWGHCWRAEEGWPQAGPFTEAECPL
jgi:hypothetical protein